MRAAGIDIAAKSFMAIGLVVDGEPVRASLWKPKNLKDSDPELILQVYRWLVWQLGIMQPDIIAVEQQAGFIKNHNVIRSLSKREGVALLAAKQRRGTIVINPPVNQARGVVFGQGNLSKEDAWLLFKKRYPGLSLQAKTNGGMDQMDAVTHGLAAPTVLERGRK
jgi:Holliday junction resolvasome RuvABC endonuclease subunit